MTPHRPPYRVRVCDRMRCLHLCVLVGLPIASSSGGQRSKLCGLQWPMSNDKWLCKLSSSVSGTGYIIGCHRTFPSMRKAGLVFFLGGGILFVLFSETGLKSLRLAWKVMCSQE